MFVLILRCLLESRLNLVILINDDNLDKSPSSKAKVHVTVTDRVKHRVRHEFATSWFENQAPSHQLKARAREESRKSIQIMYYIIFANKL